MFSNNPLYVEKLVQTKQDDILRELPYHRPDEFLDNGRFSLKQKVRTKIWVPVSLLVALVGLFTGIF
ncbi:MAG TPA: hypothetical protein VK897_25525 [Anaerolineales bacterium]|nr:hypothetical protein [Anaerolineales bacterium]